MVSPVDGKQDHAQAPGHTVRWLCRALASVLVVNFGLLLLYPTPAHAMHIAEGILPASWAAVWYVPALASLGVGVYLIRRRTRAARGLVPLFGLTGAAIFLISLLPIPVPIAGTSSHPVGTPLGAIIVGPFASSVMGAIALLMQALFLAHGGLSTWGANILSMAVVGSFVGFGSFALLRRCNAPLAVAAFTAGILGNWATYAVTSFELAAGLHGSGSLWSVFGALALAFAPSQLPLGILEGFFTAAAIVVVQQRRPELLTGSIWLIGKPRLGEAKGSV